MSNSYFSQVPPWSSGRTLADVLQRGLPCCIVTATYFYRRKGDIRTSKNPGELKISSEKLPQTHFLLSLLKWLRKN